MGTANLGRRSRGSLQPRLSHFRPSALRPGPDSISSVVETNRFFSRKPGVSGRKRRPAGIASADRHYQIRDKDMRKCVNRGFEIGECARETGNQFVRGHIVLALRNADGDTFFRDVRTGKANEEEYDGVTAFHHAFQKGQLVADRAWPSTGEGCLPYGREPCRAGCSSWQWAAWLGRSWGRGWSRGARTSLHDYRGRSAVVGLG